MQWFTRDNVRQIVQTNLKNTFEEQSWVNGTMWKISTNLLGPFLNTSPQIKLWKWFEQSCL